MGNRTWGTGKVIAVNIEVLSEDERRIVYEDSGA
jgi:ribosomal protein S28E/S33